MKRFITLILILSTLFNIELNAQSTTKNDNSTVKPKLFVAPNTPLGKAKGAVPGRVAWVHSPGVAKWDGETGMWVEDRWNDQKLADEMMRETIKIIGGKKSAKDGWNRSCRYNNM